MTRPTFVRRPIVNPPDREIEKGPVSDIINRIPGDRVSPEIKNRVYEAKIEAITGAVERGAEFNWIVIKTIERRVTSSGAPILYIEVEAENLPDGANPFIFVNPPIISSNGREDPEMAFQEMVTRAVKSAQRRNG